MSLKELNRFLFKNIPLTKQMQLKLIAFQGDKLQTFAPLQNNINDKGSVFGGSSSALMIISAWSLIKLNCNDYEIDADIVIHKNSTIWEKAMFDDLIIQAEFSQVYDFATIKSKINKNRHTRIDCVIKLVDTGKNIYSTMSAKYVIIPKK